MKKITVLFLVAALALVPAFALADTMRVQGTAKLSVNPDMAILSVGFAGESADAKTAREDAAKAIEAVVNAVKAAGVEEADIVSSYLNVFPVYAYDTPEQSLKGHRVEHMLTVTIRDLATFGAVIDAALGAGANQMNGVSFAYSKESDVYTEALARAVENATSKATALAIASGVWLGGLSEINELQNGYMPYLRYDAVPASAMEASLGSTVQTGSLEISASVEMVYEIR